MARDYENIDNVDDLDDDELRGLVRERLREHRGLDPADITVHVRDGEVQLSGRVGTDGERRVAERVIMDSLGITALRNDLVVDELRRAESPEAADESILDDEERSGLLLGDRPVGLSPEAEHLEENLDARLFGTTDVGSAIEDGTPWNPPTSPTQEGLEGEEDYPIDDADRD